MLVETLQQVGELAEAAALARVAPQLLTGPRTAADQQLAAHLSAMCTADAQMPDPAPTDQTGALLNALIPLILRSPDAVDHAQRHVLEGLASLAAAARRAARIDRRHVA